MDKDPKKSNDIDDNLDNFFNVDDKEIDDLIKQAESDLKSDEAQGKKETKKKKKKSKKKKEKEESTEDKEMEEKKVTIPEEPNPKKSLENNDDNNNTELNNSNPNPIMSIKEDIQKKSSIKLDPEIRESENEEINSKNLELLKDILKSSQIEENKKIETPEIEEKKEIEIPENVEK